MQTEWNSISKHITPQILDLLEPVHKQISSMYDSADDVELLKKLNLDNKFASPTPYVSSEPFYSHVPKNPPKTATPHQITQMALDKSWILHEIWKRYKDPSDVLGEVQFAFVCFLMGQTFSGFEQWKKLIAVICSSEEIICNPSHVSFCLSAMDCMANQFEHVPEDFFETMITGDLREENFLTASLRGFLEIIDDPTLDARILKNSSRFISVIEKKFPFVTADVWDGPTIEEIDGM
eukprot:TRINITY_DN10592_c0_g1_i1.p1 TRINITY_DN10592_c0_g1~~TRINITY_DN10592_c0_g1_i1.p1  ORF type:complete len:236 (-),score=52.31 TRINITY_DN10592_c0_g1_i1:137-844(-)